MSEWHSGRPLTAASFLYDCRPCFSLQFFWLLQLQYSLDPSSFQITVSHLGKLCVLQYHLWLAHTSVKSSFIKWSSKLHAGVPSVFFLLWPSCYFFRISGASFLGGSSLWLVIYNNIISTSKPLCKMKYFEKQPTCMLIPLL